MLLIHGLILRLNAAILLAADVVNNAADAGKESTVLNHSEDYFPKWLVDAAVIVAGLGAVFVFIQLVIWWFERREHKNNTGSLWQFDVKSGDIKPGKGFNIWSFTDAFYDRDSVEKAKMKLLDEKKNLILTGRSGLGKTRTAFEILSKSKKTYEILIPFRTRPESYDFKRSFKKRKSVILFIDDLQNYDTEDIAFYLDNLVAYSTDVQLLCTCQTEHEVDVYSSFPIPDLERYDLKEWAVSEGRLLASLLNIDFDEKAFDRTPASLIYNLDKLKERYRQLSGNEKVILESIKFLKTITLRCNSTEVKRVAENVFELDQEYLSFNNWRNEFKKLETIGFFAIGDENERGEEGEVVINDIYLSELIELDFYAVFDRYFNFVTEKGHSGETGHARLLVISGIYFERIDNVNYAEKCFKAAIAISATYPTPYYRLGSLYLKKAKNESHELKLELAKQSIEKSIRYLGSALKYEQSDYSYLKIGNAYKNAARISGQLKDKVGEGQNLREAIKRFTTAIRLNPQSAIAHRERGYCNFWLEENVKAEADYKLSKDLNAHSPRLYYYLGLFFAGQKQPEKALENYRYCIELRKDYYEAYNNIGHVIHEKVKNTGLPVSEKKNVLSEAVNNYLLAIEYSGGRHAVAYANLGHVYNELKEFMKTIDLETIAIEKFPNYGEPYTTRAYAYSKLRRFEEAVKDSLVALRLNSDSEKDIESLAISYQRIGDKKRKSGESEESNVLLQESIRYFDQLSQSKDEDQVTSAQLGKAITLEKMGRKKECLEILNKLFSDDPSNKKALDPIIQHLKRPTDNEQILKFFSLLSSSIRNRKIPVISEELLDRCIFQIQRFSSEQVFSIEVEEMLELLKDIFPAKHFVFKTSGIYYLNKGMVLQEFDSKMECLSLAESDFSLGKSIQPEPVFLKYIGVVDSNRCLALKEKFDKTHESDALLRYNEMVTATNKMFHQSELSFPKYVKLFVAHCNFLSSNGLVSEAETVDRETRQLLASDKRLGSYEVTNLLNELDAMKSKREGV